MSKKRKHTNKQSKKTQNENLKRNQGELNASKRMLAFSISISKIDEKASTENTESEPKCKRKKTAEKRKEKVTQMEKIVFCFFRIFFSFSFLYLMRLRISHLSRT